MVAAAVAGDDIEFGAVAGRQQDGFVDAVHGFQAHERPAYLVTRENDLFANFHRRRVMVQAEYLHATRYRQETTGGILEWKLQPEADMKGRTVLIVDDILDEGTTLCAIADYCLAHGASEVLTAVLVDKEHDRKARPGLKADFTGLYVEDRFLFGYGMDYKGYWRNAPGIYAVKGL